MMIGYGAMYELVRDTIHGRGTAARHDNPKYLRYEYTDAKIGLVMYVDSGTEKIVGMQVTLPLPSKGSRPQNEFLPFTLSSSQSADTTLVYEWTDGRVQYYRPGRWVDYLDAIVTQLQKGWDAVEKINGVPVEDGTLFADLDT